MADGTVITLAGELTKPATVLVEKVCNAIGVLWEPTQIRRVAKAESDSAMIKAIGQLKIEELQKRAITRFVAEETRKQYNIEEIASGAFPLLKDSSDPSNIDDDWIVNFFDKCRIVSDKEMQILWSKVLAGEANAPGSYSKRAINVLGSLNATDAQLFTNLCDFVVEIGYPAVLVYSHSDPIYNVHGISFSPLMYLAEIGLITYDFAGTSGFRRMGLPQCLAIRYAGMTIDLKFDGEDNNSLDIGRVLLTDVGRQLTRVCTTSRIEGFIEYFTEKFNIDSPCSVKILSTE